MFDRFLLAVTCLSPAGQLLWCGGYILAALYAYTLTVTGFAFATVVTGFVFLLVKKHAHRKIDRKLAAGVLELPDRRAR